jgi:mRNA-degrading endonuclease RelE of RelBE toxin-antitoxin system
MKLYYAKKFKKDFQKLPATARAKFYKQATLLLKNLRHPSLHAKKYSEKENVWQARVDHDFRFYFLIERDSYILLRIRKHPN